MVVQEVTDNIYYIVFLVAGGNVLLSSAILLFYIRYQKKFLRQNAEMQQAALDHKQHLLHATIKSQEDERTRISKELHDHVGSSLAALRMMIARAHMSQGATSSGNNGPEQHKQSIDHIMQDVRNIAHSLSPAGISILGVKSCLHEYCDKMSAASGIVILLEDHTSNILQYLNHDNALSLFRIIQELITNTLKHAGANSIFIDITQNADIINVTYRDDGRGMDTRKIKNGIGIYNIESRLSFMQAGYSVVSAPDAGYSCTIAIKKPEKTATL